MNNTERKLEGLSDAQSAPTGEVVRQFESDVFDRRVWNVFGLPIDLLTVAAAANKIEQSAQTGAPCRFVTPNVNWLCMAQGDDAMRGEIVDYDLSLADGSPIVWLAKLLGAPISERCAGSDLFDALRNRAAVPGRQLRVFFFGGRDGAAEAAHHKLNAEKGGVVSTGWINPGFGSVDEMSRSEIIDAINAADADFIVVALGGEKGHAWIAKNKDALNAPVISHLGAVVDFAAGTIKRAPAWMSRLGLEWCWRIAQEPSLWRRYARDGKQILKLMFGQLLPALMLNQRATGEAPQVAIDISQAETRITLSGDLLFNELGSIRKAFREAATRGQDVRLDFAGVGAMDGGFLGLVTILERRLALSGARLRAHHRTERQHRMMALNGVDLEDAAVSVDAASDSIGDIASASLSRA